MEALRSCSHDTVEKDLAGGFEVKKKKEWRSGWGAEVISANGWEPRDLKWSIAPEATRRAIGSSGTKVSVQKGPASQKLWRNCQKEWKGSWISRDTSLIGERELPAACGSDPDLACITKDGEGSGGKSAKMADKNRDSPGV